jgi:hypothetical protein
VILYTSGTLGIPEPELAGSVFLGYYRVTIFITRTFQNPNYPTRTLRVTRTPRVICTTVNKVCASGMKGLNRILSVILFSKLTEVTDYLTMLLLFFCYVQLLCLQHSQFNWVSMISLWQVAWKSMSNGTQSWIAKHLVKSYVF